MSVVVLVRIPDADIERALQVERDYPELQEQLDAALKRHGNLGYRRLYRDGEILWIHEWETREGVEAFREENLSLIRRLAELRGSGTPTETFWNNYSFATREGSIKPVCPVGYTVHRSKGNAMSIVVLVNIPNADIERVRQVERDYPELQEELMAALKRHGNISHRRLYRDNEILDVDEWESEEGIKAFLEENRPLIRQLAELRGTGIPTDSTWQIY